MGICGIDEAGRGPLAGPVVAAAVILPRKGRPSGLADSKTLSPDAREALASQILACAHVGIGRASVEEIDTLNIRQANLLAMGRAFAALSASLGAAPAGALIDGVDLPDLPCAMEAIVRGDAHVPSICAASIIAKTCRDGEMLRAESDFPGYGFGVHKGYGTAQHLAALRQLGPCALHRRSFRPVMAALHRAGETS
jgi:ribonuclease HII